MSGTSGTFSDTRSQARRASSKLVVYDSLSRASAATLAAGTEGKRALSQPLAWEAGEASLVTYCFAMARCAS